MNIKYLTLRLVRHFMPESIARFLLKRRWLIRPGLESSDPLAAVEQYISVLEKHGSSIKDQRVLVFGYGGRFAVGVELLNRGAAHVVLCDHIMSLDKERNMELLPKYAEYLYMKNDSVMPDSKHITLLHGDICDSGVQEKISAVDFVLSTSVYEHLNDVDSVTQALAKLITSQGVHLHFVDLRDHYFKYPFEMLTFPEDIWKKVLNPTSNLNRFRLGDYKKVFEKYFGYLEIIVSKRNVTDFNDARKRIRTEFLTGDDSIDSVELIYILAKSPKS